MSRFPKTRPRDLLADPRRPTVSDLRSRYQQYVSRYFVKDDDVSGGVGAMKVTTHESVRVRSVEVQEVAGGTITIQVSADGRNYFDTAPPVSGAGPVDVDVLYPIPAGTVLTATLSASAGAPTGEMNVIINAEPLEVLPQPDPNTLSGGSQLRTSRRTEARRLDTIRRSTLGIATDQTELGRGQVGQVRDSVGRNARSLRYPTRSAFRGSQRSR